MRERVLVVFWGLISGALGAALFAHFTQDALRPVQPLRPVEPITQERARPSVILPPGWDPTLVDRVAGIEKRMEMRTNEDRPSPSVAPASEPADSGEGKGSEREQERFEHYQKELADREQWLRDHEQESIDRSWAEPQAQTMKQALLDSGTTEPVKLSCRSKTCAAAVTFPTPGDALMYMQGDSIRRGAIGCKGFIVIPTPPANDGPYDLTIMYTCR